MNIILEKLNKSLNDLQKELVCRMVLDKERGNTDDFFLFNDFNSEEQVERFKKCKIFACTILSLRQFALSEKDFDYCVVDESSQILEPICLFPLFFSQKFVLFGDHKQLCPITSSPDMKKSLFETLASNYPQRTSVLRTQYRMNSDIMELVGRLFYNSQILQGKQQEARIEIPQNIDYNKINYSFVNVLLSSKSVCFLDVISSKESQGSRFQLEHSYFNEMSSFELQQSFCEENAVLDFALTLLKIGLSKQDFIIITTFNRQLNYLKSVLKEKARIITIDKSQGMEARVVLLLLSVLETQSVQNVDNMQRLNVALSRA